MTAKIPRKTAEVPVEFPGLAYFTTDALPPAAWAIAVQSLPRSTGAMALDQMFGYFAA